MFPNKFNFDSDSTPSYIRFKLQLPDKSIIYRFVSEDCPACNTEYEKEFYTDCKGDQLSLPIEGLAEADCVGECQISCWKSKFLEIGFDNTGTSFRDTNASITLEYQDCPEQSFDIPNTNSWTAQTQAFADGFFATQPDLIEAGIFCTRPGTNPPIGCANLPTPVVFIQGMKWRYAGARACLGTKLPFKIIYNSDQRTDVILDYAFAETPLIYWDRIVDKVTGEEQWRIQGQTECQDERPECVIPCGEEFPTLPDVLQCDSEITDGCFCSEEEGVENQNGITRISKVCEGEILQVDYYSNFGEDNQELLESEGFYFDPTCDCSEPPICLRTYSRCNAETCEKVEFCELSNGEITGPFIPGTEEPSEVEGPYVQCECPVKTLQCYKDQFIEGGLDNTKTHHNQTNQTFEVTFDNGDVDSFTFPSSTGWTDQVDQISAGLSGIMPTAQTVGSFCNRPGGCGGLPAPIVELNLMRARYTGCLLYTSPSPRDKRQSRMPSSA